MKDPKLNPALGVCITLVPALAAGLSFATNPFASGVFAGIATCLLAGFLLCIAERANEDRPETPDGRDGHGDGDDWCECGPPLDRHDDTVVCPSCGRDRLPF